VLYVRQVYEKKGFQFSDFVCLLQKQTSQIQFEITVNKKLMNGKILSRIKLRVW